MTTPSAKDVKVFVPTKDFETSVNFYQDLGWTLNWREDKLAEVELAGTRLFLQDFYAKEWAENFMVYVVVRSAAGWYQHAKQLLETGRYPSMRVKEPKHEPYGATVCYVWDPCGILLHFAEFSNR
ncbi:Glyoxalase-like domain protein [Thalassoglobus neptunius]|uniref:Glyoxalase-like domain protein n=1 Tax=Thalassoglobus neptunius TaxID=1938619 RepID=A0A5C5WLY4_9PLAN|nr:VOC family protein [Thalassoglobus neptunius]TWT51627.1 Glyoxalase-like domain protein [Thalassoglobus neptunius]